MKRQYRTTELPESMLDLIWILLLYFLMISTVRTDEDRRTVLVERVPYLERGVASVSSQQRSAVMTLTASGGWSVDGEPTTPRLLPGLLARLREDPGISLLLIDVDRGARVDELLAVQDIAQAAQLEFLIRRDAPVQRPPAATGR